MDIQELTKELNTARILAGSRKFNRSELKEYLKGFKLPRGHYFTTEVRKLLNDGQFPNNPIHINIVNEIYKEAKALQRRDNRKYLNKQKEKKETEVLTIPKAIALLKENGYKILAPITEYKEV